MNKKAVLSIGSAILLLAVILFALSRSTNFESTSNYALTAGASSNYGDEYAYLRPAPSNGPLADMAPSAVPGVTDTNKTPAAPQNYSTAISNKPSPAEVHAVQDSYCNFYAQDVTGNVTPEQAEQRQEANGAIVGAIGGALLGAMFGGSGDHPGRSMALGAGAGLAAGAAAGTSNAHRAADDIRTRYDDAYTTCMARDDIPGITQSGS